MSRMAEKNQHEKPRLGACKQKDCCFTSDGRVEKAPDPAGKDAGWPKPSGAQMCTSTLRQAAGCSKSIQTLHGVVHLPAA